MIQFMVDVPNFVKREIEKIDELVSPFLKKASQYALFSFPLIIFSIMNLSLLLFFSPQQQDASIPIIIYAVMGAIGLALSKEAKIQRMEIQTIRSNYMIERIKKSEAAPEPLKKHYISLIKDQPIMAMQHFITFLKKENEAIH
ncbi:hypothetical protein A8F94_02180 [Bacillus sp. FJAT-27225]|uniref:DUF5392 family protein n=1 Tax=Bacillus sp. FJAT-27225 TaxID=1743144 RepID=UPI00080C31FE|nr:DUF5392 family protein [Bacillus sp. FJAT-27225]OCA90706.1 hypothetical protein A8F94_02180 [Bacillus sp. FJAT-27225]